MAEHSRHDQLHHLFRRFPAHALPSVANAKVYARAPGAHASRPRHMSTVNPKQNQEDPVRPHSFDGIQEYDKRMPNWWLWTLYSAIAFALAYWAFYHAWQMGEEPG